MKALFNLAKKIAAVSLALALCVITAIPLSAYAAEPQKKVVKVGWYESSYCYFDKFGRRRGVAYEYQQKIAAHTGWKYEYVEDSWPNLLQMLKDGKIDLLSDVSYTEERAGEMLYPSLPMGAESYYIYIDADNKKINTDDMKSLNGKKVGVNKDSIQADMLRDDEQMLYSMKFGIFADAQQEPDIEERFVRAQMAADSIEHDPDKLYIFYEFENSR